MAEVLLRQLVEAGGEADDWWIESAGTAASPGDPAMGNSQIVASERGMDLSLHRSQLTDSTLINRFALMLVMEARHKQYLQQTYPSLAGRVHLLKEMVGQAGDIHDPVGSDVEHYRAMTDEVSSILADGFERISELAEEDSQVGR